MKTRAVTKARGGTFVAMLAMLLLPCGCGAGRQAEKKPPAVGVIEVRPESVDLIIESRGRTVPSMVSDVRPQINGLIKSRLFSEGELVRAGQPLYEVDSSLYRAAVDQARARLAHARAEAGAASALARRYAPLKSAGVISEQSYINATSDAAKSAAAVLDAQATLKVALINLRYTRIEAPISGRVGRSLVTPGALVTAGQTDQLAVIQKLDPMLIDLQQSSTDMLNLRRKLAQNARGEAKPTVELVLENGEPYRRTAVLQFAEAIVDATTGSIALRASVANPDGELLPGMFVRARVNFGKRPDVLLVPAQAVGQMQAGEATVWVVGPDDHVEQRSVRLGDMVGGRWIVTGGLKAGDRLIVRGANKVKPKQLVQVVPVPGAAPPDQRAAASASSGAGKATGSPALQGRAL